jgi:hypothetical protein
MKRIEKVTSIEIEDEHGPFYLSHGVSGNTKITALGRSFMVCRCCIRDRLKEREPDLMSGLTLIAMEDPILAKVAVMRFELAWKTTKIARKLGGKYTWRDITYLERKVINKIREGVCRKNAKR